MRKHLLLKYYLRQKLTPKGNIYVEDIRIKCTSLNCISSNNCYPFVCYQCLVCNNKWWTHCRNGRPPRGVCRPCWEIQRELTDLVLKIRVENETLKSESKEWWEIFSKGVNPTLYCYHSNEPAPFVANILKGVCRHQVNNLRCNSPDIKDPNWNAYIQRYKKKGQKYPPEDYPCCREDGAPRDSKHPSRRARQREKLWWRMLPRNRWNQEIMDQEMPRDWE